VTVAQTALRPLGQDLDPAGQGLADQDLVDRGRWVLAPRVWGLPVRAGLAVKVPGLAEDRRTRTS